MPRLRVAFPANILFFCVAEITLSYRISYRALSLCLALVRNKSFLVRNRSKNRLKISLEIGLKLNLKSVQESPKNLSKISPKIGLKIGKNRFKNRLKTGKNRPKFGSKSTKNQPENRSKNRSKNRLQNQPKKLSDFAVKDICFFDYFDNKSKSAKNTIGNYACRVKFLGVMGEPRLST